MHTRSLAALLAVACAAMVLPRAPARGETVAEPSWPDFHGPNRQNISPETGLLKRWPEGGPRLVWKYSDCGAGCSGVSIAEGKIYTAGDFGDEQMLLTLSMDGKLLWKAANGESWQRSSSGSRTTPAGFKVASQFDLGRKPDNSCLAHPVICGGRLYLRCDQDLMAHDVRAE
jgi:hypothetical protein